MHDEVRSEQARPPIAASLVALRWPSGPCAAPELDVRVGVLDTEQLILSATFGDWPGVIVDGRRADAVEAVADLRRRLPALRVITSVDDLQLASRLLRAGARRVVPAGRWDLLVAAVHHELGNVALSAALHTDDLCIETVLESSTDLLVVVDEDGTIRWLSPAAIEALDIESAALHGLLGIIEDDDRARCAEFLRSGGRSATEQIEYRIRSRSGDWLIVQATAADQRSHGDVGGIVVSQHDVTIARRQQAQLEHQATHDALTDLPTRPLMLEHLANAISRMRRDGRLIAVCFLDLDGFKAVNDRLGHEAGDEVLIETARRLTSAVRSTDLVARIGGDEFIVILDGLTSGDDALRVADKLIDEINHPLAVGPGTARVGASIGIALASGPDDDANHLLADADAAMYQVKASGKNGRQLFDDLLRTVADDRSDLERRLRTGLDERHIRCRYAPILGLHSGEVVGFTAAQWWSHPESGELASSVWRVLADEAGFGDDLDHRIIEEAVALHARWGTEGRTGPTIWLPCTRTRLLEAGLADQLAAATADGRLATGALGLRITESDLAKAPTELATVLAELESTGVRFALDRFRGNGVGPDLLQDLPVDTLLLDPHFAQRLGSDERATRALAGIVAMSRPVGLDVVATGVDNHTHLTFVLQLSCANATGALFAHPQGAERTSAMLRPDYAWNLRAGSATATDPVPSSESIEGLGSPARR
ncbi:MAG: diguanylate cyclase [Actinomycetota bacterium]